MGTSGIQRLDAHQQVFLALPELVDLGHMIVGAQLLQSGDFFLDSRPLAFVPEPLECMSAIRRLGWRERVPCDA